MIRTVILAALALACLLISPADARHKQHAASVRVFVAHPDCNVVFPCEGVVASPRGEMIARQMGFGAAQKQWRPASQIVAHPAGCPRRAFCGCGAAVRVFGAPLRALWLAANWFRFPRAVPAAGMVAVRRHHVFVLERHLGGDRWLVFDANSGRRLTRIHARSIAGYTIVNPHGAA